MIQYDPFGTPLSGGAFGGIALAVVDRFADRLRPGMSVETEVEHSRPPWNHRCAPQR